MNQMTPPPRIEIIPSSAPFSEAQRSWLNGFGTGLGSNDIGMDRGALAGSRIVMFDRVGPRVLMVQPNLAFRASGSARQKYSALIVGRPGWAALIRYELVVLVSQAVPLSWPLPPLQLSLPAPPSSASAPAFPFRSSAPLPPQSPSSPFPPRPPRPALVPCAAASY